MIVLYIFLGLIAFLLLYATAVIFIPFKMFIKGTYWDKNPTGQMDTYWIKYFLGVRLRIKDLEHIHVLIWFLGIPIPIRLPLSKDKVSKKKKSDTEKRGSVENETEKMDKLKEKETKKKNSLKENILDVIGAKDQISDLWNKYKGYIKKIFVSYVTFSFEYLDAELGLKDPAQTGKVAGILYSTLSIKPLKDVNISWDYQKPSFNISAGAKMTMKLYGILCTLFQLYWTYKKDLKNEN
ncbi:MAG: hypothetical protein KAU44_03485 [Candidatus Marinimicrobia bacterium]|nr:hypothetical protein [Candidatus Neomarinimicrobiota bacterium]